MTLPANAHTLIVNYFPNKEVADAIYNAVAFPTGTQYGVYNLITDFGATGISTDDATAAFEAAFDAAPTADWEWDDNSLGRPAGGILVHVPGRNSNGDPAVYKITSKITPDARKSVTFVTSEAGARITMDSGDGDYWLQIPASGDKAIVFDGFVFDGCGIEFAAGARLFFTLRNCKVEDTRDYFIKCLGDSVHNVSLLNMFYSACNGVVYQAAQCEKWWIENFVMWRCSGDFGNMVFRSARNTIKGFDCEAPPAGYEMGYFTFMNGPNLLEDGAFGTETSGASWAPPMYPIHFGLPATQAALPGAPSNPTWIKGVHMKNLDCEGANTPTAASAVGVIQENVPIRECVFEPKTIGDHYSYLINENFTASSDAYCYDNIWVNTDRQSVNTFQAENYSRGGVGWNIDAPVDNNPDTSTSLGWADAGSIDYALSSGVTAVQQTTPSDMYKVTIDSDGDFVTWIDSVAISTNVVTFSIQAMAGTLKTMRMAIYNNTDGAWVSSPYKIFRLKGMRKKFTVTAPWTSGKKYRLYVYPGTDGDASGYIYLAQPYFYYSVATVT